MNFMPLCKKSWTNLQKRCDRGDFNAKVGRQQDSKVTGISGLGEQNSTGKKLVSFCKKFALQMLNTSSIHGDYADVLH